MKPHYQTLLDEVLQRAFGGSQLSASCDAEYNLMASIAHSGVKLLRKGMRGYGDPYFVWKWRKLSEDQPLYPGAAAVRFWDQIKPHC
jgi:hypothetical protein